MYVNVKAMAIIDGPKIKKLQTQQSYLQVKMENVSRTM